MLKKMIVIATLTVSFQALSLPTNYGANGPSTAPANAAFEAREHAATFQNARWESRFRNQAEAKVEAASSVAQVVAVAPAMSPTAVAAATPRAVTAVAAPRPTSVTIMTATMAAAAPLSALAVEPTPVAAQTSVTGRVNLLNVSQQQQAAQIPLGGFQ